MEYLAVIGAQEMHIVGSTICDAGPLLARCGLRDLVRCLRDSDPRFRRGAAPRADDDLRGRRCRPGCALRARLLRLLPVGPLFGSRRLCC